MQKNQCETSPMSYQLRTSMQACIRLLFLGVHRLGVFSSLVFKVSTPHLILVVERGHHPFLQAHLYALAPLPGPDACVRTCQPAVVSTTRVVVPCLVVGYKQPHG
jgi:hypothetical protein